MVVRVDAVDGARDFCRAILRGFDDTLSLFFFSDDILEYDDRVIDQHADGQRDATERHDVEGNVVRVHQQERADH